MNGIFHVVARSLNWLAGKAHVSYEAANIVVYYVLIPASWVYMIDAILGVHYGKVAVLLALVAAAFLIREPVSFAERLFARSVNFLLRFRRWGMNYVVASVAVCAILPLAVYVVLIVLMV